MSGSMSDSGFVHEVYDASYRRLVAQMYALCGDQADAEDAVQEAFVKAIGRARQFATLQGNVEVGSFVLRLGGLLAG